MSNKAKRNKASILAETKQLLLILLPAIQKVPKIERIEGAPMEMKRAAFDMISDFTIAYADPDCRLLYIRKMIGDYAKFLAAFEIAILQGLFTDSVKVALAFRMERIEEGISKWRNAQTPLRQIQGQVDYE